MFNKTVLITGGSRGIGAETARVFARAGYNTLITYYKSEAAAQKLVEEINASGGRAVCVYCDVRSQADTDNAVRAAEKFFGGVDVSIVSAGAAHFGLVTDITPQEIDDIININLKGAIYAARSVIPRMVSQKSGSIIFISSIWGMVGASCEAVYSAAKAGVIGLTKALAKELGPSNIRVNCVAPGVITTDMTASLSAETLAALKAETSLGKLGSPSDIAACALYLAQAEFMTGQIISPNGGLVI